jgi:oxygen-dependent protoporphyrinogen oxidase
MTNTKVVKLTASESNAASRFTLVLDQQGRTEEMKADAVVLATPAFVTAEIVSALSEQLARILASIEYPPLASVCLGYDEAAIPRPIEGFGFLIPRNQDLRLLGCLWSSSLFPGRAPQGKVCLTNFVGGATDPAVRQLSDTELVQTVHQELQTTLGVKADPHVVALHRYARAIPQYTLGHQAKLQEIEKHLSRTPGLFLASNYLRGVSVGDCVKEATKVAKRVTQYLNR